MTVLTAYTAKFDSESKKKMHVAYAKARIL